MLRLWRAGKIASRQVFLNEVSTTLSKLRSGKKNIPVNLINIEDTNTNTLDTSHIDERNNISNNDIVPETAYMGQSQQKLVDLDMPLGDNVPVTVSASFLATCGASALSLNPISILLPFLQLQISAQKMRLEAPLMAMAK